RHLPGGWVTRPPGAAAGLARWLAAHADVNALDLAGVDPSAAADLERAAAQTVKRVLAAPPTEPDWTADPGTRPPRASRPGAARAPDGQACPGRPAHRAGLDRRPRHPPPVRLPRAQN